MEKEIMRSFFEYIIQGGPAAIVAILLFVIGLLIWDRIRITKALTITTQLVYDTKDKEIISIKEIIDKYYQGNINLVNALNEIKIVLTTIQNTKR